MESKMVKKIAAYFEAFVMIALCVMVTWWAYRVLASGTGRPVGVAIITIFTFAVMAANWRLTFGVHFPRMSKRTALNDLS